LLLVLSVLLLGAAGLLWRGFWILLAVEAGMYFLGLAAGASDVGLRSGWQYAPMAPLVFVILHFGYGLGSLWGVIRFCFLKGRWMRRPDQMRMSR
jgi:hypothetical protein